MFAKYDVELKMFGFYSEPVDGGIELTDEQYGNLLSEQSTLGVAMQIVPDEDGFPICVTLDSILTDEQKATGVLNNNTVTRTMLLNSANEKTLGMSDAFVAGLLSDADVLKFKKWAAYKLALGKVDISKESPSWPVIPS